MIKDFANKVTIDVIKKVMASKKYLFFENGDYNLNIIGFRNPNLVANSFDDTLGVFYKKDGQWVIKAYPITTDAGTYWLKNPLDVKGTAILVPNQYKGVYAIRPHNNKYDALCQTNGDVEVFRDKNKDQILNMDKKSIVKGMFGINIHRSNPNGESISVDKWSAGCQVFKSVHDFNDFMLLCDKSRDLYGNKFTYTLLEEKDVIK